MLQAACASRTATPGGPARSLRIANPSTQDHDPASENVLQRLVRIHRKGEALLKELRLVELRLAQARAYLASAGGQQTMGRIQVLRLQKRRERLRDGLEAQEVEALEAVSFPFTRIDFPY